LCSRPGLNLLQCGEVDLHREMVVAGLRGGVNGVMFLEVRA
jgi:hypothetical protein